jgi:hypothetical protein
MLIGTAPALARLVAVLHHARHLVRSLLILGATVAIAPQAAHGGTYTVHGCQTPSGDPAPMDRWEVALYASSIDHWGNACPRGGLWMTMDPNVTHPKDDVMRAVFTAPADTLITSYEFWRSVQVVRGTQYYYTPIERNGTHETQVGKNCKGVYCDGLGVTSPGTDPVNAIGGWPVIPATAVGIYLACGYITAGDPDCPPSTPAVQVALYRSDITLADDRAPKLEATPIGALVAPGQTLAGMASVSFQAGDLGGGVADVAVEIDGNVVAHGTPDDQSGTCHEPYVAAVPCPLHAGGSLAVDTAKLADGPHRLRLLVRDAAGNVTFWGPLTIQTDNAPPDSSCVPTPALSDAGSLRTQLRRTPTERSAAPKAATSLMVAYARATELRGRLTAADGQPVPSAPLCLLWRPLGSSAPLQRLGTVTTDADGRFAMPVGTGSSREVLAIRRLGDGAIVGRSLLRVVPRVTAHAPRGWLHNGRLLNVTGQIAGGPFPRRGILLNMQVVRNGRWQGFGNPFHSDSRGRFRARYRFQATVGRQRYKLRVRVGRQFGYPYEAGASRALIVRVVGPS